MLRCKIEGCEATPIARDLCNKHYQQARRQNDLARFAKKARNRVRQLQPEETAWLAGLIEGEGCFSINRHKRRGKSYAYAVFTLAMTDEDVVRKAHALSGVGGVTKRKKIKDNHKTVWVWTVGSHVEVMELASLVKS